MLPGPTFFRCQADSSFSLSDQRTGPEHFSSPKLPATHSDQKIPVFSLIPYADLHVQVLIQKLPNVVSLRRAGGPGDELLRGIIRLVAEIGHDLNRLRVWNYHPDMDARIAYCHNPQLPDTFVSFDCCSLVKLPHFF